MYGILTIVTVPGDLNTAATEWYRYRSLALVGLPKISSNSDMLVTINGS